MIPAGVSERATELAERDESRAERLGGRRTELRSMCCSGVAAGGAEGSAAVKTRVHLLRSAARRASSVPTQSVVADVEWRYWVNVLGVYRDARRDGATQATARALVYFTLRAVEAS